MKSIRKAVPLLLFATVASTTLACSGDEPGDALPVPSSESDVSISPRPIPEPLDISGHLADPCKLVPQDFMATRDFTAQGERRTGDSHSTAALVGPGCSWQVPGGIKGVLVSIQTGNREQGLGGLPGLFQAYQNGQFEYWEETTVKQYPAAYAGASDLRDKGDCGLAVGIQEDLSFTVMTAGYTKEPDRACTDAKQVAEQVIETLKGGS